MVVHVYNPGPGKMEIGRPWGALPGQPRLLGHFHASDRPHLIKKKKKVMSGEWQPRLSLAVHVCICVHTLVFVSSCMR